MALHVMSSAGSPETTRYRLRFPFLGMLRKSRSCLSRGWFGAHVETGLSGMLYI